MTGFLVELFSSDPPLESRAWLAEQDGRPCVVSRRDNARIFATLNEARLAGNNYVNTNVEEIMNYEIRQK